MVLAYKCENCGHIFQDHSAEWHRVYERHYWLDDSPLEQLDFMACPECGSEDWETVIVNEDLEEEVEDEEDESTE